MPIPKTVSILRAAAALLVFVGIITLADVCIYLAAESAWPLAFTVPQLALKWGLFVTSFILVSSIFITSKLNNLLTRFYYLVGSIWMGLFFYLFLGSFVYGLAEEIYDMTGGAGTLGWLGQTIAIAAVVAVIYGIINAEPIRVTRIKPFLANLPDSWKGKRAVYVSDIHLGQIHTERFARRVTKAVNAERPDIIFVGGDLYDGVKVNEQAIIAPFAAMTAPKGVYYVTGNHEEFSDSTHFLNAVRGVGMRVLMNEMVDVDGLQIIGMTDHDSVEKDKLVEVLTSLPLDRSRASIFLKHQPSHLEIPDSVGINMQISGHTHRAQMFPLNVIPYWIYKGYSYGLKKFGSMHVFTSSGVGSWGAPMRVGSDSEIVVIEFV